jgi:acyl-ACP thioesterase
MKTYRHQYTIEDNEVDCHGNLKPSMILFYAQDIAGRHCQELQLDYDTMAAKRLFWAVIRHRVQVSRMPQRGETVTVQTWPMPTTRVAYPRATVAYDTQGKELFRIISLWVLMDLDTRAMILPGKSGVEVEGLICGGELAVPGSLMPKVLENREKRTVRFSDLDRNGHMNNCRYLEWITDLLPSEFHKQHRLAELTVCYVSEAREGQELELSWQQNEDGSIRIEAARQEAQSAGHSRVFAAQVQYI